MLKIQKHNEKPFDLHHSLVYLTTLGDPRLSKMSSGWHACIAMRILSAGVTFDITTEFKEPSPSTAIKTLLSLVEKCLIDMQQ